MTSISYIGMVRISFGRDDDMILEGVVPGCIMANINSGLMQGVFERVPGELMNAWLATRSQVNEIT